MRCPACKLNGAYIRRRTNEIVCRMCGVNTKYEELAEVKEEKKN